MKAGKTQKDSIAGGTSLNRHCTEDQTAETRTTEDHTAEVQETELQASENQIIEGQTGADLTVKDHKTADSTTADQPQTAPQAIKKLAEMNLLDNFLFGSVVTYPEIGEEFVRFLLKTILGREVKHLSVTAQKVFYGADSDLHGARLDVYLEPEFEEGVEGNAAVYDIEPESANKSSDKKALPRRTRFYHGKIATRSLKSGAGYEDLKNVMVIMIMPFDPFDLNRMAYTIKNRCEEVPEMEYEDGASTLFLYTKGTEGIPSETLRQMLHYMEETTYENAVNEDLREIHRMVETVKKDQKVARIYMQMVDDIIRQRKTITEQAEKITKLEGEKAKQAETITEQAEEIRKLLEELNRRKDRGGME